MNCYLIFTIAPGDSSMSAGTELRVAVDALVAYASAGAYTEVLVSHEDTAYLVLETVDEIDTALRRVAQGQVVIVATQH